MQTEEQVMTAEEEAQEEAAFNAAFDGGTDSTDLEPVDKEVTTEQAENEGEPEPVKDPEPEPAKVLTMDDFNAALAEQKQEMQKIHDKVFGKVGELKQRIDALKSVGNFSPKAKARLEADFPELAEMLFDNEQTYAEPTYQAPVPAPVHADPRVDDIAKTFERKLLTRDHRDWEQVVQGQEFADWKYSVLDTETAAALDSSWDADFISAKLTDFKTWKEAQAKKGAEAKLKHDRLEAAIIPRGVPKDGSSYNDDDEEASMMKAFGKRH